ncbi:molybdopterin molybdotransferase MoeA [Nocardia niigatensis]|uniref:molybdopterin molybdotransferase MoeA n=1 Tax=Nocardia niigatensis TaxID=209249 RepID=UPI00030B58FE|nr:molybdopterin-binding protein [Nocardia niigatensis]
MSAVQIRSATTMTAPEVIVEEIEAVLSSALSAIPARRAPLSEALGATLAEPLTAMMALPAADTAAMDGFAVSGRGPRWRLLIGSCTAGRSSRITLAEGEAVRIATGALTPPGATAVLRAEYVRIEGSGGHPALALAAGAPYRNDIRPEGESWYGGDELAAAGGRVSAAVISVAQSADAPIGMVRGPLRADLLITGDEIRATGSLGPGQIRDALGAALPHYLGHCDIGVGSLTRLPDDRALLRSWFDRDTGAELAITVGATGRGAADRLRDVLGEIGAQILIDGVRLRPGGSQLVARLPDGRTLLSLPGSPLAAITASLVTGRALVNVLTGRRDPVSSWGRVADAANPDGDRVRIVPVRQVEGGVWRAIGAVRTAHLAGLLHAHALAVLPPEAGRGTLVELLPLPR